MDKKTYRWFIEVIIALYTSEEHKETLFHYELVEGWMPDHRDGMLSVFEVEWNGL